jgi:hypothetical protein
MTDYREVQHGFDALRRYFKAHKPIFDTALNLCFADVAEDSVFLLLVTAVVSLKHEGIHEEREWRVIYSPKRSPSPHFESSIEVFGGVPQQIYKIPFRNDPGAGISGLEPNEILDRIIIGPTQFPWAMYEAFVAALAGAGIKDAASRVFVSQIPVRT